MPLPAAPLLVPNAPGPRSPDNLRGIILMALGFFAYAAGDVLAKLLTESFHAFQIVWFRQVGLCLGVLVIIALRGPSLLRTPNRGLQVARGVAATTSAVCFIAAIRYVPLADAVAVSFVAPFVVTVLGALILREQVGLRRWSAVAVGFVGMLVVIRPGFGVFHPAILLVLVAASAFALRQILSRWLSGIDSILTTVAYTSLTSTALATLTLPFVWQMPVTTAQLAMIFGLAASATIGEVLIIRALDIAQAVVLAPVHYSLILWGTFYGYIAFADLPDGWTLSGCAIIMASGMYTLHRERRAARR